MTTNKKTIKKSRPATSVPSKGSQKSTTIKTAKKTVKRTGNNISRKKVVAQKTVNPAQSAKPVKSKKKVKSAKISSQSKGALRSDRSSSVLKTSTRSEKKAKATSDSKRVRLSGKALSKSSTKMEKTAEKKAHVKKSVSKRAANRKSADVKKTVSRRAVAHTSSFQKKAAVKEAHVARYPHSMENSLRASESVTFYDDVNTDDHSHEYKGWLNSNSFLKRSLAVFGHNFVGSFLVAIPFYIFLFIFFAFLLREV